MNISQPWRLAQSLKNIRLSRKFIGQTVLVTGGTGSFGRQITKALLRTSVREIRVLSRDEDLQHQMASTYLDSRLKFLVGDVRDLERTKEAARNADIVVHAAALKQVPDCEVHPLEAVKTNIVGANNVKMAAQEEGVGTLVFISTDKAVKPVNAMGMSKALQEKIMLSPESSGNTRICGVRYGNVLGSRGSVVPRFIELKKRLEPIIVTHPDMTRFMLTLDDATALVLKALVDGRSREMIVMKKSACKILDLAEVIAEGKVPVKIGSVRAGEKIHETLVQEEEMRRSIEDGEYYHILPHGAEGVPDLTEDRIEYTSENTSQMTRSEVGSLLRTEGWI